MRTACLGDDFLRVAKTEASSGAKVKAAINWVEIQKTRTLPEVLHRQPDSCDSFSKAFTPQGENLSWLISTVFWNQLHPLYVVIWQVLQYDEWFIVKFLPFIRFYRIELLSCFFLCPFKSKRLFFCLLSTLLKVLQDITQDFPSPPETECFVNSVSIVCSCRPHTELTPHYLMSLICVHFSLEAVLNKSVRLCVFVLIISNHKDRYWRHTSLLSSSLFACTPCLKSPSYST